MKQEDKNMLIDILSAFSHILDDMDSELKEMSSGTDHSVRGSIYRDIQNTRSKILEFQKSFQV